MKYVFAKIIYLGYVVYRMDREIHKEFFTVNEKC